VWHRSENCTSIKKEQSQQNELNHIHEFFQAAGHYATQVMARGSKHQAEIMDIPDAPDFIIHISLVYFYLQIITKPDILRQVHGENSLLGNYMLAGLIL